MNKAVIPFGGQNAVPGPMIPVLNVQLPITEEYREKFEAWALKTGLDPAGIARILVELGIVSLNRIFDEETPKRPAS